MASAASFSFPSFSSWLITTSSFFPLQHHRRSSGASEAVFVTAALAVAIAQASFSRSAPPEPAVYRPQTGAWDIDHWSRPLHVGVVLGLLAGLQSLSHYHHQAIYYMYMVLPCLPLLWLVGLLPPLRAFTSWAVEQYTVIALGGTPASSDLRALWQAALGTVAFGITYVLLESGREDTLTRVTIFASTVGFVLSIDPSSLQHLLQLCKVGGSAANVYSSHFKFLMEAIN